MLALLARVHMQAGLAVSALPYALASWHNASELGLDLQVSACGATFYCFVEALLRQNVIYQTSWRC